MNSHVRVLEPREFTLRSYSTIDIMLDITADAAQQTGKYDLYDAIHDHIFPAFEDAFRICDFSQPDETYTVYLSEAMWKVYDEIARDPEPEGGES